MKANLKNFTTKIPAYKSISEIEIILVEFGAQEIMKKTNSDRQISAVMFTVFIDKNKVPFRLPVNVEEVAKYLSDQYNDTHTRTKKKPGDFLEHAYDTAWRIMKDWIHAQLSIIATGQVELVRVMLPYAVVDVDKGITLGDKFINGEFRKMLPSFEC